jgi:competence protein ComEA
MAGGAKKGVDLSDINLAHIVVDGEQLYVGGSSNMSSGSRGKLNINRASKSQFDSLPGIGPVLASRIIAYRTKNGPFTSVDDLQKVSGIGGSKFDDIKDLLRI